jgi:DNA repair exonuclease SbcCD ATPase subunit
MLAQGAFTKFFNSKGSEKSDILEKLTGTEIYSKISIHIHETARKKREIHEAKKQEIKANEPLPTEERESICDLLLVDDDTLLVTDSLLQGLDKELNDFIEKLLEE